MSSSAWTPYTGPLTGEEGFQRRLAPHFILTVKESRTFKGVWHWHVFDQKRLDIVASDECETSNGAKQAATHAARKFGAVW